MAYLDHVFPKEEWVVYYDLQHQRYHVDSYLTHQKLVINSTDTHLLFLYLGVFSSHQEAVVYVNKKRAEDLNSFTGFNHP